MKELDFNRTDGTDRSGIIYFLPWRTSFATAQACGLLVHEWRACYELPLAILSPEPSLCSEAIQLIVHDVEKQTLDLGPPSLAIGFSMGTVPATLVASRYRIP